MWTSVRDPQTQQGKDARGKYVHGVRGMHSGSTVEVQKYVDEHMWKSVRNSTNSTIPCEDPHMEVGAKIHESKRSYMEVGAKIPLEIVGRA